MTKIKNENELKEALQRDIEESGKNKVVIQSGHFPLLYLPHVAIEGINHWGQFSPYTLELGCKIGSFARELGKDVRFVFFADDHLYEFSNNTGMKCKTKRSKFYRSKSGIGATLHPEYQRIMREQGFSEKDVIRHNQGKQGREDCLYFSEKLLRNSTRDIGNVCAREYVEFLENPVYFDKTNSHLISFVPNRCKVHICDVALDVELEGISSSHVFIETMMPFANREELYREFRGVTYRGD